MAEKRVKELEAIKTKLLKQQSLNQVEIALEYAKGKQEGRQEIIDKLLPILPLKNTLTNRGNAYNVLVRDIHSVIETTQKSKLDTKKKQMSS